MDNFSYWKKQGKKALFVDVDTFAPEQKRFAGKVLVVGGHAGAFFAPAAAMQTALNFGAGEVRVLLPSSLRGKVPSTPEIYFAEAGSSGAFGKASLVEMLNQAAWADAVVLIGDLGKNAETSIVFADFMKHCEKPVFVTRDAVDAIAADAMNWGMREQKTALFLTMAQLQKLLRTLYYPKVITLSMPMNQLVETLHKFTLSYPLTVATLHGEQVVIAREGAVISEDLSNVGLTPITLWNGDIVTRAAVLSIWNETKGLEQIFATSLSIA